MDASGGGGESGLKKTETAMNIVKMLLLFLFLGAVAFGIYYLVKHGGKCLSPANWISCIVGGGGSGVLGGLGGIGSLAGIGTCAVGGVASLPSCQPGIGGLSGVGLIGGLSDPSTGISDLVTGGKK